MNTEAQRRASAEFVAKRKAAGWRKVTLWMHPDTIEELQRLAKIYGNQAEAAAKCINHHCDEARRKEARQRDRAGAGRSEPPAPQTPSAASKSAIVPVMERKPFNPQPKTGKKR